MCYVLDIYLVPLNGYVVDELISQMCTKDMHVYVVQMTKK